MQFKPSAGDRPVPRRDPRARHAQEIVHGQRDGLILAIVKTNELVAKVQKRLMEIRPMISENEEIPQKSVERIRDITADLVEQCESAGLPQDACVQTRILNAYGNARSNQRQQARMFFFEVVALRGLNVHHANHAVLGDQGNSQFGTGAGDGGGA